MKYALISDIHSQYMNLDRVLSYIHSCTNECCIINLGDSFEVKISKKDIDRFQYERLEQVLDFDRKIIDIMLPGYFLLGNQEDRILKLIPEIEKLEIGNILSQGIYQIELPSAILSHGHKFEWLNPCGDMWHPVFSCMPKKNLIYGHNHKCELFELRETNGKIEYINRKIRFGEPIYLHRGKRYLINVGDIKKENSNWLFYDEDEQIIIYHHIEKDEKKHGWKYY